MLSYTKRLGYVLVALAVVVLLGCDSQDPVDDEDPPEPDVQVTVAVNDSLDEYLTDADGHSLYLFTDENGNPVPCTSDDCLAAWPPLLTEAGEVEAEGGADASLLSTTERPDGTTQVVYNGWPLYYFVNDNSPGDVNGQGIVSFGGTWLLISPAGEAVETSGANDDDTGDDTGDDNDDDNDDDPGY